LSLQHPAVHEHTARVDFDDGTTRTDLMSATEKSDIQARDCNLRAGEIVRRD